jgi:hypothetical protein
VRAARPFARGGSARTAAVVASALAGLAALAALVIALAPPEAWRRPGASLGPVPLDLREPTSSREAALAVWHRFAANALLAPLHDPEAEPLRWRPAGSGAACAEMADVNVGGRPLAIGEAVPDGPLAIRFDLHHCLPFGPESIGLTGRVEVDVRNDGGRWAARIVPRALAITAPDGARATTSEPFDASLDLGDPAGLGRARPPADATAAAAPARTAACPSPSPTTDASRPSGCRPGA